MKEFTFSEICRLKKWRLLQVFFKDFTETMCYCYLPLHFLNLVKLFSVIPPPPPSPPQKKNTLIPGPNLDFLWIWQSKAVPFCENSAKLYFVAKHLGKGLNTGCWSFWVPFFCKKVPYLANFRCCPNFLDWACILFQKKEHGLVVSLLLLPLDFEKNSTTQSFTEICIQVTYKTIFW